MTPPSTDLVLEKRDTLRKNLKNLYHIPPKTRAIIISRIQDEIVNTFLKDACEALDCTFLKGNISAEEASGADAVLLSGDEPAEFLTKILQMGVVPIVPKKSKSIRIFEEFNPMKFTGNAFIFKKTNPFLVFEKVCGFLENMRYPGDKKILTKNIKATVVE